MTLNEESDRRSPEQTLPPQVTVLGLKDEDPEREEITRIITEGYQKNKEFFEQDSPSFKIELVYTREEYEQKTQRQNTPPWSIGNGNIRKLDKMVIFHPSVLTQVSQGIHSPKSYPVTMTHEIAHIFEELLFHVIEPAWLGEGLADYITARDQRERLQVTELIGLDVLHDYKRFYANPGISYAQSFLFVGRLIRSYGKEPLFNLLKSITPDITYPDFLSKFQATYGISLDEVENTWIKEEGSSGIIQK